ncbi:MAG TPA: methylenetetrahydrofolate reductase [Candidatus Binataceae bacterium]
MTALLESLASSRPQLWVEVAPPRGVNPEPLLRRLAALKGHADAINLTDNALGRVKMSGLVFASILKSSLQIPVVLNMSCRDRNRLALRSDLLGAAALAIDAVVALTGDKIAPNDPSGACSVHDLNAFGLFEMIASLNRGDTGEGKAPLKVLPEITVGAVANPNRANLEREYELLERKAASGARFIITQPVFDPDTAVRYAAKAASFGLKTVLGILPVKREAMATYMKERIKDLADAHHHLDRYHGMTEAQVRAVSRNENLKLMKSLAGEVAGFNIMSGGGPSLAIELALEFSRWRKDEGS